MRETENCALKLTIFYLAQAFLGYCSLHQVQWNKKTFFLTKKHLKKKKDIASIDLFKISLVQLYVSYNQGCGVGKIISDSRQMKLFDSDSKMKIFRLRLHTAENFFYFILRKHLKMSLTPKFMTLKNNIYNSHINSQKKHDICDIF